LINFTMPELERATSGLRARLGTDRWRRAWRSVARASIWSLPYRLGDALNTIRRVLDQT
jgi:hypothetical protein